MRTKTTKSQKAFNDGRCSIYTVEKRSIKEKLGDFDFQEETVGVKAFYEFHVLGIQIEKVISIPFNELINPSRVVKIGNDFYTISLIQKKDTFPISLRLSLSKSPLKWNGGGE